MAPSRVAKGTWKDKTSGTTLNSTDITVVGGNVIDVGLIYLSTTVFPSSVKFGDRLMRMVPGSRKSHGTANHTIEHWRFRVKHKKTRKVRITWPSAIGARVISVSVMKEVSKKDVGSTQQNTASTTPGTGTAVTTTEANTLHIAYFGSNGPVSDTPGTANLGHTLGQRDGTIGAPPISNVTIQETYEILSATGDCRATLSGATARDWVNTIVAFKSIQTYTILEAYERYWTTDTDANTLIFRIKSEDSEDIFEARIDPDLFDEMTDTEVNEFLQGKCAWHVDHDLEGPSDPPEENTTRDTRLATFVNDTFDL